MASLCLKHEGALVDYILSFQLSKTSAIQISRLINHWLKHHGTEWTVSRLKDVKQQRILFESGSTRTLIKSDKDSIPKGPLRVLWKPGYPFENALRILNVYTSEKSDVITKKQIEKFVTAVRTPASEYVNPIKEIPTFDLNVEEFLHNSAWIGSSSTRAPYLYESGLVKTKLEIAMTLDELLTSATDSLVNRRFLVEHADLLSESLGISKKSFIDRIYNVEVPKGIPPGIDFYAEISKPPIVGKIGYIQEKGMKLRAVANPFRIFQHALYPLGAMLYDCLKQLDSDCTFDQSKGYDFATNSLNQGKTIYAYDLSNATDMFPYELQLDMMKKLVEGHIYSKSRRTQESLKSILDSSIRLLTSVSRGRWYSPETSDLVGSDYLEWSRGQPLGLYPSFALFALTHNILLWNIERECRVRNTFRILGDDVIINDEKVALRYKEIIDSFGCKISDSKTVVSNNLTEFAGKIFTSKDGLIEVPKWIPYSKKNPLGPLTVLGIHGLKFVKPSDRNFIKFASSLPYPYGLEINPLGIPLSDRVEILEDKLWKKEFDDRLITDYNLSKKDWKQSYEDFWTKVDVSYDKYRTQPTLAPLFSDQERRCSRDKIVIDHYNSYISSLKNWDIPTIERPSIQSNLFRGDPRKKDAVKSNFIFKFARKLKEKYTNKAPKT